MTGKFPPNPTCRTCKGTGYTAAVGDDRCGCTTNKELRMKKFANKTVCGSPVRILCTDRLCKDNKPIIGLITLSSGIEQTWAWFTEGKVYPDGSYHVYDLVPLELEVGKIYGQGRLAYKVVLKDSEIKPFHPYLIVKLYDGVTFWVNEEGYGCTGTQYVNVEQKVEEE